MQCNENGSTTDCCVRMFISQSRSFKSSIIFLGVLRKRCRRLKLNRLFGCAPNVGIGPSSPDSDTRPAGIGGTGGIGSEFFVCSMDDRWYLKAPRLMDNLLHVPRGFLSSLALLLLLSTLRNCWNVFLSGVEADAVGVLDGLLSADAGTGGKAFSFAFASVEDRGDWTLLLGRIAPRRRAALLLRESNVEDKRAVLERVGKLTLPDRLRFEVSGVVNLGVLGARSVFLRVKVVSPVPRRVRAVMVLLERRRVGVE